MKKILFERPIGDYLPDEFKRKAKDASKAIYDDPENPAPSSAEVASLMMGMPSMEIGKTQQLLSLALDTFYKMYPDIKKLVDNGRIRMDVQLGSGSGGRMKQQSPSSQDVEQVRNMDPDFEDRIKQRNFQMARVQGTAWRKGFGAIEKIKEKIESIDPRFYNVYDAFVRGASRFYWENTKQLEKMASSGAGRVAYCDVYPDKKEKGVWVFEARAPHLPLLMMELVKGAEYYDSLMTLPKNKKTGDVLMSLTDTHKHEIQNMNFGRQLTAKIEFIFNELVEGYEPSLQRDLITVIEGMGPRVYNRLMDGIVNDDQKVINEFINLCEEILKTF
jgi:hypothetical protein